jgi:vacuolar-type H+-ATPase subunit F/Vma7
MTEIVVIGDKFLNSLFQLDGIKTIEVPDDDAATHKVYELMIEEKYKLIIINENVASKLKDFRQNLLITHRFYPVFLIIPGLDGSLKNRITELRQLVSQSLGIKLKFGD